MPCAVVVCHVVLCAFVVCHVVLCAVVVCHVLLCAVVVCHVLLCAVERCVSIPWVLLPCWHYLATHPADTATTPPPC